MSNDNKNSDLEAAANRSFEGPKPEDNWYDSLCPAARREFAEPIQQSSRDTVPAYLLDLNRF